MKLIFDLLHSMLGMRNYVIYNIFSFIFSLKYLSWTYKSIYLSYCRECMQINVYLYFRYIKKHYSLESPHLLYLSQFFFCIGWVESEFSNLGLDTCFPFLFNHVALVDHKTIVPLQRNQCLNKPTGFNRWRSRVRTLHFELKKSCVWGVWCELNPI